MAQGIREPLGRGLEIVAVLELFKMPAHRVTFPRSVAGRGCNAVPVAVLRVHGDHGVVRRAAAERAGARIENSFAWDEFTVALRIGRIVLHVEVPREARVFGSEGMKSRYLVVVSRR